MKVSEVAVASAAERWMVENGYEVYREVRRGYGDIRADLVGKRGKATHVIECKTRLSLDLIEQAAAWIGTTQQVSVAVPNRRGRHERLPTVALRCLGIGLLKCEDLGSKYANARGSVPARWHRLNRNRPAVLTILDDAQKAMGVAGSNGGGYFTEFRYTMRLVREWVEEHPGCTIRDVVDNVEHHYASDRGARQGLCVALKGGLCDGVRFEGDPHRLYLAPKEGRTDA